MKNFHFVIAILGITFVTLSCEKNKDQEQHNSYLQVYLTDSPAEYDAVLIDVQDVKIKYTSDSGWTDLDNIEAGIYNLLDLTGGIDTLIAYSEVSTGSVTQIRLILGDNNSLVIDGDTVSLKTPSGQQSGLKIKVNYEFIEGLSYKILLDFDAAKSVVKAGNSGNYILKPVIRAIVESTDGAINGSIPDSVSAVIYAIDEIDSVSTYPDSNGFFFIGGLNEGYYDIAIDATEEWSDTTISDVMVLNGQVNELGFIPISEK